MTEAMPFLQKYDITFLRPPPIPWGCFCVVKKVKSAGLAYLLYISPTLVRCS